MNMPTAEYVRDMLSYDQATGVFAWKRRPAQRIQVGDVAGKVNKRLGRRYIGLNNKLHLAHRLAWLHVYGEWPSGDIDHINGDPLDNRLSNLRDVSHVVNMQNMRGPRTTSTTGHMGVTKDGAKFSARIRHGGKTIWLGSFRSAEMAGAEYLKTKRLLHAGCTI